MVCGDPSTPVGSVTLTAISPLKVPGVWVLKFSGVSVISWGVAPVCGWTLNQSPWLVTVQISI